MAGRSLTLLFGLAVAALLATGVELAYRHATTGRLDLPRSEDLWVFDPELLYRLNPENPDTPGSFRGGPPASPPQARHRIVCLGGSSTFGHGVAAGRAWPAALGRELRFRGLDAEAVNGGVPGYGSRQLLLRYRRDVAPLRADVVVLYAGWNRTGALVDPAGFVPAGVPRPTDGTFAARRTRLAHALARRSLLLRRSLSRFAEAEAPRGPWRPDPHESTWAEDVRTLVAEIQARGQRPLVVLYPSLLHAGMTEPELELYRPHLWRKRAYDPGMVEELARKHALLRAVAAERGVPVADLQGALQGTRGAQRRVLFLDNMHLTAEGNQWVAVQLAPQVAALLEGSG